MITSKDSPVEYQLDYDAKDGITRVKFFRSDSTLLGVSSWDGSVSIHKCDLKGSNKKVGGYYHKSAVLDIDVSKRGHVFSVGLDKSLVRFDLTKEKPVTVISKNCHNSGIRCVNHTMLDVGGELLVTGSWDKTVKFWDVRMNNKLEKSAVKPISTITCLGKVFSMDFTRDGKKLVIGTHNRKIEIYELAFNGENYQFKLSQTRKSPLLYQTRCVRTFPNGKGYVVSSVEARVGVEFFENSKEIQQQRYAFKCHRVVQNAITTLFPINVLEFHSNGSFLTGGCDGKVFSWDPMRRKKIKEFEDVYPSSISSLSYNSDETMLAIASSYTFEMGEKDHPKDKIYIKPISARDVVYVPKKKKKKKKVEN